MSSPLPSPQPDFAKPDHRPTSGLAIASFYLGILGVLVPPVSLVALTCGVLALRQISKSPQIRSGRDLAKTGVVLGVIGAAILSLLMSLLIPMLSESARGRASIHCASNLRQIGMAIQLYANDHRAAYPPDLQTLVDLGLLDPKTCVCPSSNDSAATGLKPTLGPGTLSYIYLGAGQTTSTHQDRVIAYEPLTNHPGDGGNVLFGDGRVEGFDGTSYAKLLADLQAGKNPPLVPNTPIGP